MAASNSLQNSHGKAISAYLPPFRKGAVCYGENIQSGVLVAAHFAGGLISAVVSGSITGQHIKALSVTSAKLGTGSVTNAKIASAAVTKEKIGANAVRAEKISAGAVIAAKIGAQAVTSAKIKAAWLSGTLVSGRTTRTIAHGLGVVPKFVIVNALPTLSQAVLSATTVGNHIYLAAASAATSTNIYVIGTQAANAALKYVAYVQA